MKLTKSKLKQLIKEELQKVLYEWPEGEAQLAPGKRDRKNRVEEMQYDDQTGDALDPEASFDILRRLKPVEQSIGNFIKAIEAKDASQRMEAYNNLAGAIEKMGNWPSGWRHIELERALAAAGEWGQQTKINLQKLGLPIENN